MGLSRIFCWFSVFKFGVESFVEAEFEIAKFSQANCYMYDPLSDVGLSLQPDVRHVEEVVRQDHRGWPHYRETRREQNSPGKDETHRKEAQVSGKDSFDFRENLACQFETMKGKGLCKQSNTTEF